jgi:hypothetical protein
MSRQLLAVVCGLLCLTGCRAVTLASYSNTSLSQGMPFISDAPLIQAGISDPRTTIDFGGLNTGGGRWELLQEIATITQETRLAFQGGKYSSEKHDTIAIVSELMLTFLRTLMSLEASAQQASIAQARAALPRTLPEDTRTALEAALQRLETRTQNATKEGAVEFEDGVLEFLKQLRDMLRELQHRPDPGHGELQRGG